MKMKIKMMPRFEQLFLSIVLFRRKQLAAAERRMKLSMVPT